MVNLQLKIPEHLIQKYRNKKGTNKMLKDNKDYNKAEVNTISQFKKRIMKFN